MDKPPTKEDAVLIDPGMFCEEHIGIANEWNLPILNVIAAVQGRLLESETFYEIAYRIRNGYGPPEGMDVTEDVPEFERPGVVHINDALEEVQPLCCWLVENVDDPFPESSSPVFLNIIAEFAEREFTEEEDGDE